MKKLRVLSLLLAALMAMAIVTGCGEGATDTSSVASTESTEEVSSEEEVEDLVGGESSEEAASEETASTGNATGTTTNTSSKKPTSSKANTGVPVVSENPELKDAVLPKYDIKPLASGRNKGKKMVTICIDWEPTVSWMEASIKAFQKVYPDVTLAWKQASPDLKASKLAVWKNSKSSPDAIYIKPEESWPLLMEKGLVQPIDQYIKINDPFWADARGTMNELKYNGKYYMTASSVAPYGWVIYNPTVFKNAGLETPESLLYKDKWTWETFENAAKKLTKANADPTKAKYGIHFRYSQAWHGTCGMDYIGYKDGKWVSNLNNPVLKSTMEKYFELVKKYSGGGDDPTQTRQMLINGQIGMYVTCEGLSQEFPDQAKAGTLVAVCMPRKTDSKVFYNSGVISGYCIPEGALCPEGGMAFVTAGMGAGMGLVEIPKTSNADQYTQHQDDLHKYCYSVITGTVMHFRRLERIMNWWSVTGPVNSGEKSYAAVVAEVEPKIQEELNKMSK